MNTYRVLTDPLRPFADGAVKYFSREFGVNSHKIESEVHPLLDYRPTLHWITQDKYVLCAEVCDILFPSDLERAILSCRNHGIPAKLFVVIPSGSIESVSTKAISFTRENGIGILEVDEKGNGKMLSAQPIPLSLTGLRSFDLGAYPPKYRNSIKGAIETFKLGNPPKACALIYDEIEALTRKIAIKAQKIPGGVLKAATLKLETDPWHNVITYLQTNASPSGLKCPDLKTTIFNRLIGTTPHRNDTGHKPRSTQKLIERDQELRTRFESAVDDLRTLIRASAPMKP